MLQTPYEQERLGKALFRKLNNENPRNRGEAASELVNIASSPKEKLTILEALLLALIDEFDVDAFRTIAESIVRLQDMHAAHTLYALGFRGSKTYKEIAGNAALKVMSTRYNLSRFTYVPGEGLKPTDKSWYDYQIDTERGNAERAVKYKDITTLLEYLNSDSKIKASMAAGALAMTEDGYGEKIFETRLVEPLLTCIFDPPNCGNVLQALKKYKIEQATSDLIWLFKFYWPIDMGYVSTATLSNIGQPAVQPITQAILEIKWHIERLKNIDTRWNKNPQYLINNDRPMFPAISQLSGAVGLLEYALENIKY